MRFPVFLLLILFSFNTISYAQWQRVTNGIIPTNAFAAGHEADGTPIYIARVSHEGGVHLGKVKANSTGALIPFGGRELYLENYEVYTGTGTWVQASVRGLPTTAIRGGQEADGTPLYIARALIENGRHPGKVRANAAACIPYGGIEKIIDHYQVLVSGQPSSSLDACVVVYSQPNYRGLRFELCFRGPQRIPFVVQSVQVPNNGWEVAYVNQGSECFSDIPLNIVSQNTPSLANNPPCANQPFWVISRPDGFNILKITVKTGGDDLRGGNRFFCTLHMRDGTNWPEVSVVPPNGLAERSFFSFNIVPANNLNYKDIAGITIRHDGNPRPGNPFDHYDNWNLDALILEWANVVPKAVRFTPTRFTGENKTVRFATY